MLEIFRHLFGNIAGFSNWVKKLTTFGAVNQLEDIFYNSFQKCLQKEKSKANNEEKIIIRQLEWLLRLERDRVMALFKSDIQDVSDFSKALTKHDFIESLAQNFLKILNEEYNQPIDDGLAQKLIGNALSDFQDTVFNQLSEKQGIYVVLHQVFESHEVIERILNNTSDQVKELKKISLGIEANREAVGSDLKKMENRLLEAIYKSQNESLINSLISEYKNRLNKALDFLKNQNYDKAEQTLLDLKSKLKRDQIDDNELMYLTLSNLGKSRERLGKLKIAGQNYVDALIYAPNSAQAIYQALVGYKVLNQADKAEELRQKLELNHQNTKEYFTLQINENNSSIEDIISSLPTHLISHPEINYAIANAFLKKDDIEKYKTYMLRAIANSGDNVLLYKPILAYNISHIYSSKFHSVKEAFIPKEKKNDLYLAIKLYKEVWEVHKTTNLKERFIEMPINISTTYSALGIYEEAIHWIDVALDIKDSPGLNSQKIYFLKKWGKQDILIKTCKEINDFTHPDYHDALMIFTESLYNTYEPENQDEAISRLENFITNHPDSHLINRAKHFLLNLYLGTDRLGKMENLLINQPKTISILSLKGRLAFAKKEFESVDIHLKEAINLVTENTTDTELSELAISLMESEKFTDAASIFEKFLSPKEPTYLSECLINCYKEIGDFDKIINHCEESLEAIGITTFLSKELINAYVYIKDYQSAFDLMNLYCSTFQDEVEMLLRLGELTFYLEKDTKDILSKIQKIPIARLSALSVQRIAAMLIRVGKKKEALDLAYEMRRFFDTAEAHQAYIFISVEINQSQEELAVEEVGVDTVVFLEKENATQIIYIIEDRVDTLKSKHEINTADPLFKKLSSKKVGNTIPWGENKFFNTQQTVFISKILTKYHYAFLQSVELLNSQFSDDPNLKLVVGNGIESIEAFLEQSFEDDNKRQKSIEQLYNLYKGCEIPFGLLAIYGHNNPILLWRMLVNDKSIGINCSSGFEEETVKVFSHLENNEVELCCDITSILALHHLELGKWINTFYGKLHISYSTLELVKNLIIEKERDLRQKSFQIIHKNGQQFRYEQTKEEKEAVIKYYKNLLSFVEKHCHSPLPVNLKKEGKIDEHKKKAEIYGNSFYDTVLIAQENNFVLLSDDYVFREVTKGEIQIQALGTADLIKFQKQHNTINNPELLNEKLVKLLLLNYKRIAIKEDVLYTAIKMDSFESCHHFFELNSNDFGKTLIKAFHFMNRLLTQPIIEEKKVKSINDIMSVLTANLLPNVVLRSLRHISYQTNIEAKNLFVILETWYKTNVASAKQLIQIEDFKKLDIRTGTIISVRLIPERRLIEVVVDFGFDKLKSILPDNSEVDNTILIGKNVCAIVNFPTQNNDNKMRRCHILTLQNEYTDLSLLTLKQNENGLSVKVI